MDRGMYTWLQRDHGGEREKETHVHGQRDVYLATEGSWGEREKETHVHGQRENGVRDKYTDADRGKDRGEGDEQTWP